MKIENIRVKILKDTPFHFKGEELKLIDFRAVYNWICTSSTTNEQLVNYIKSEYKTIWSTSKPPDNRRYQLHIGEWFEIIELQDLEPLQCIIEDVYYTKGFDGMYHMWTSPSAFKLNNSIGKITIPEMRKLIEDSKFKQEIVYYTNDINKKL